MAQTLNAAVLSKDAQFTAVIRDTLSQHEIELSELDDVLRFIDLISQEPFDLVVLDCEGLVAAKQVIGTLRQNGANREAVLAVAAPQGDPGAITAAGANLIMPKPLAATQAKQFLHDAIEVIKKRHRQYVRHPMETDVLLQSESKKLQLRVKSYCIGEGGIGLQLQQRLELGNRDLVRLNFQLPGTVSNLELSATLAYINNDPQAGFKFEPLSTSNSAKLSAWLNQQAPPPAGTPRKELVEQWLAEHGKESGTVVISAAVGKQLLAEKLAAEKAAAAVPAAPKSIPVAIAQPKRSRAAVIGYVVGGFVLGVVVGLLLARFLQHL
jgi:DNA-binding response OmpR family regulator